MWQRIKEALGAGSQGLRTRLRGLWGHASPLEARQWEELEDELISWDMGAHLSQELCQWLRAQPFPLDAPPSYLYTLLAQRLSTLLAPYEKPLKARRFHPTGLPQLVLVLGTNGAGKTTLLAKLAHYWQEKTYGVHMIAGDTFRAAAPAQLAVWSQRTTTSLTLGHPGEDPASVIFRGLQEAIAQKKDMVLVDTAGRLGNKKDLVEELGKIHRMIQKQHGAYASGEAYERFLVLDGTTGYNVLSQVQQFHEAVPLTGLIFTKMDSSAKGGMVLAATQKHHIPIVGVGTGESLEDFTPFSAQEFVAAAMPQVEQG